MQSLLYVLLLCFDTAVLFFLWRHPSSHPVQPTHLHSISATFPPVTRFIDGIWPSHPCTWLESTGDQYRSMRRKPAISGLSVVNFRLKCDLVARADRLRAVGVDESPPKPPFPGYLGGCECVRAQKTLSASSAEVVDLAPPGAL
ncbi:hypothetical protein EDB87DRAFT_1227897 [Lactarius vividus]|nr:hypothetical protein EDB87DRAFT_1227897 [Lactarius vividus]